MNLCCQVDVVRLMMDWGRFWPIHGQTADQLGELQGTWWISGQTREVAVGGGLYNTTHSVYPLSTAIGPRKYRIPSDLRSQAGYRLVSTTVGDHVGILGAVVFAFGS